MTGRSATHRSRAILKRTLSNRSLSVAVVMLIALGLLLAFGSFIPGYDPAAQSIIDRNQPPFSTLTDGSTALLGTDALGRDLLSRLVLGGRVSLLVASLSVAIALVMGTVLGVVAGFFGGAVERVVMGLADLQLSIPRILLVIAVVAVVGPSLPNLIIMLGITSWVLYARVIRAMTLSLRRREFTLAAELMGATRWWNIRRHVLPHTLSQIAILAAIDLGTLIMLEAALSYLGLGVQAPLSSWGLMINEAEPFLNSNPLLVVWPGLALFLFVAGTNIVSRAFTSEIEDEYDPQSY